MENQIKERREQLGLSQGALAKACGVSRQTINAIENNKYDPTLDLAFRLAHILATPVAILYPPTSPKGRFGTPNAPFCMDFYRLS